MPLFLLNFHLRLLRLSVKMLYNNEYKQFKTVEVKKMEGIMQTTQTGQSESFIDSMVMDPSIMEDNKCTECEEIGFNDIDYEVK